MKRKRFSVKQTVAVLKQAEVGVPVAELIRQVGISEQTLYRWKKQYKRLETDQVRKFIYRKNKNQFRTCGMSRCPLAFLLSSNLGAESLRETPRLAQAGLEFVSV